MRKPHDETKLVTTFLHDEGKCREDAVSCKQIKTPSWQHTKIMY